MANESVERESVEVRAGLATNNGNGTVRFGEGEVDAPAGLMDAVFDKLQLPQEVEQGLRGGEPEKPLQKGTKKTKTGEEAETPEPGKEPEKEAEAEKEQATAKLLETLSQEDRAALEAMEPAEREAVIEDLLAEDAKAGERGASEREKREEQAPEFSPEQEEWVAGLQEEHEAAVKEVQEKVAAAEAKVQELETQLTQAKTQPVAIVDIDPLFLLDDAAGIDQAMANVTKFQKWLMENWDGSEAVEKDGKVTQPAYTKEQIRGRYAELEDIKTRVVPAAKEKLKERAIEAVKAKEIYPNLFNPKSPDSAALNNLLKLMPGIKAVLPDIYTIVGDALVGERIRKAKAKLRGASERGAGGANGSRIKSRLPMARRAGGGGAATGLRRQALKSARATETGQDTAETQEIDPNGFDGTRRGLVDLVRRTTIPTRVVRKVEE